MASDITSPFSPGRPVPVELFVGRVAEIERLRQRAADALAGHVEVGFVVGERGIGKSSLASFVRSSCERDLGYLGMHTMLGGVTMLEEMARRVFEQLLKASVGTGWYDKLKGFFGEHIREVGLFGISVRFDPAPRELRGLVRHFATALRNVLEKLRDDKQGILLILDDINGLAVSERFANWFKSLVDGISVSGEPFPLCLLLVGLEERRRSLTRLQPSLSRVFDIVDLPSWSDAETREFFTSAFAKANLSIDDDALALLCHYTGGLPVLGHEIGHIAFNTDQDGRIGMDDATDAVIGAAEVVGRRHLEPKVCSSMRSPRYRGILRKIVGKASQRAFKRAGILSHLTSDEATVLDNFLRKMVELGVLARDAERGPGFYAFTSSLHYLYFQLEAERARRSRER